MSSQSPVIQIYPASSCDPSENYMKQQCIKPETIWTAKQKKKGEKMAKLNRNSPKKARSQINLAKLGTKG